MSETKPTDGVNGIGVDKQALYGEFLAGEQRRARIYERGVQKALDLADDEMNVETTIHKSGLSAGGVAAIAAALGLPTTIAAAALAWQAIKPTEPATPPAPTPASSSANVDTDSSLYLLDKRPTSN